MELRRGRDGKLLPYFYGRYVDATGKSNVINLGAWQGTPPPSGKLTEPGDPDFEAARAAAQKRLADFAEEARRKGRADHLQERLIEAKTGRAVEYTRLADLPERWRGIDRDGGAPTERHLQWCDSVFRRFAESARGAAYLYEVKPEHVRDFRAAMKAGHSDKTVRDMLVLLRGAFKRLLPTGSENPFAAIRSRKAKGEGDGGAIARRPLTEGELGRLLETARPDPLLYPLAVCAAHSGMRIGDVCSLQWPSVDLRGGFLTVATAKTGAKIEAPILPRLRGVLETAAADREPGALAVWPEAARMYKTNKAGVIYRGKALFARAFAPAQETPETAVLASDPTPAADVWAQAADAVAARFCGEKAARILDTLRRVAAGASYGDIQKATGRPKGQTSEDLREAESVSGLTLRRGAAVATGRNVKTLIEGTRQRRARGAVSASVLGWHNLRGTFVVLALNAGIPFETVMKITGHTVAKTVRDHYYAPTREHTRAAMQRALPAVLTGGKGDPLAGLARQLKDLKPADRARLAKLLTKRGGTC